MTEYQFENRICKDKNILIVLNEINGNNAEFQYLIDNFCGKVINSFFEMMDVKNGINIYCCGDFSNVENMGIEFNLIQEFSTNYENWLNEKVKIIPLGEVPIVVGNSGVYYRNLFSENDYFNKIKSEHVLQNLTESNKESKAYRMGIYLSEILKKIKNNTATLNFHLLRCSSNFTEPTDNFRISDHFIVNKLNECVKQVFEKETKLNHVLAQIYENTKKTEENGKEIKAKIKAHSDKTKDMPKEGLIAFCTFYDRTEFKDIIPS